MRGVRYGSVRDAAGCSNGGPRIGSVQGVRSKGGGKRGEVGGVRQAEVGEGPQRESVRCVDFKGK